MAPEPTETQDCDLAGAEICAWPDGSRFVRLATGRHVFQARAILHAGCSRAALFCGPAAMAGTFAALARALSCLGASALYVHPRQVLGPDQTLSCCERFLRQRGVERLALVGAGQSAAAAVGAACALDAECVVVLAPPELPTAPQADLLRGRPLLVCSQGDEWRLEPLAGLPHATRAHFALAGACFDEVRSDLTSVCVPFLAASLGVAGQEPCRTP